MARFIRNVLGGMGSILSMRPTERPHRIAEDFIDVTTEEAMRRDWSRVGADINGAVDDYKRQNPMRAIKLRDHNRGQA
ncbi:MAG: hypothetical protein AB7U73_15240 [Pirellulales bacterium]